MHTVSRLKISVWNREVLFWGVSYCHARRRPSTDYGGPDSGPTPDPLSLCQNDINLIVTGFNAVIKIVLTSGYATWFTAGDAIRIAHYDVITRKL